MLGGRFRASFRPLNDNIINGRIRGVVGIVGCTNPKVPQDYTHTTLARELIKRDILVSDDRLRDHRLRQAGIRQPEDSPRPGQGPVCGRSARQWAFRRSCACGSCVDNSRLLVSCSELVREGGLGEDLSDLPIAGACLESMHEKAIAIGQYFVASGALVVFADDILPIAGSANVSEYLYHGIEKDLGGRWAIESDPMKAAEMILAHIESKRDALGINKTKERKLYDMADRRALAVE